MPFRAYSPRHSGPAVLFVSAEWCPHCKVAKPELKKAASILGSVIPVLHVDSARDAEVIKALKVRGYPTILYRDQAGRTTEYSGERTGLKIADWVCAASGACYR